VGRIRGILLTVRIQLLKILFYMAEKYKIESKVYSYNNNGQNRKTLYTHKVATGPGNYYILHRCISCSENNHHIAIFIPQSLYLQQ
jgi:hypothetical protein